MENTQVCQIFSSWKSCLSEKTGQYLEKLFSEYLFAGNVVCRKIFLWEKNSVGKMYSIKFPYTYNKVCQPINISINYYFRNGTSQVSAMIASLESIWRSEIPSKELVLNFSQIPSLNLKLVVQREREGMEDE